jgi:hypothetical protein
MEKNEDLTKELAAGLSLFSKNFKNPFEAGKSQILVFIYFFTKVCNISALIVCLIIMAFIHYY